MNPQQGADEARIIVIDIDGVLNGETARALESNVDSLLAQGKHTLIFHCRNLSYVTSHGIGSLLSCTQKISRQNGYSALVELSGEVETLLSVLKISKFLNIYPTKQDAVDSFKQTIFPSQAREQPPVYPAEDERVTSGSKFSINEQDSSDFDNPLIIECSSCASLVRVYRPGEYICPGCKTQFCVLPDGTAIF